MVWSLHGADLCTSTEGRVEVEAKVEAETLRLLPVAEPFVSSLTSCEKGVLTSITSHSISGLGMT